MIPYLRVLFLRKYPVFKEMFRAQYCIVYNLVVLRYLLVSTMSNIKKKIFWKSSMVIPLSGDSYKIWVLFIL